MTPADQERARYLRGLVVARTVADREEVSLEDVDVETVNRESYSPAAVTDRVAAGLESWRELLPSDEVGDPRDFACARDILLARTRSTVDRLVSDPTATITADEAATYEAIVRTDGTRPTLLVRNGTVDPNHPQAGSWAARLGGTLEILRDTIAAVGRIEPAGATGRNYFGTGWVVDASERLVLTNHHVVTEIWKRFPHRIQRQGTKLRIVDDVFIDFVGESGSVKSNRFKVVEATPAAPTPGSGQLDAAVLRVEPTVDSTPELPSAIRVVADPDGALGNLESACTIGFPGPPRFSSGVRDGVDWDWATRTLFGGRFGVKRLAPGVIHRPLGSVGKDRGAWIFGHDMTTLGGSSGSPVINWLDEEPSAFGLHFAGASVDTNLAHAVAKCVAELTAIGVPVVEVGDI